MGNQNPYIEEEQRAQWPNENAQKDKQRSTKHTYKTKDHGFESRRIKPKTIKSVFDASLLVIIQ